MSAIQRFLPLVARVLLVAIFIIAGVRKIPNFEMTAEFMAGKGMPMVEPLLWGAIAVEVLGGVSVVLGLNARMGALALAIFLVPTTLIFHDFWTIEDAMMRRDEFNSFLHNIALMGGLLLVVSFGSGPLSVDNVIARRAPSAA